MLLAVSFRDLSLFTVPFALYERQIQLIYQAIPACEHILSVHSMLRLLSSSELSAQLAALAS